MRVAAFSNQRSYPSQFLGRESSTPSNVGLGLGPPLGDDHKFTENGVTLDCRLTAVRLFTITGRRNFRAELATVRGSLYRTIPPRS